ncbi:unnamed protein product, partial [Cyprideis torosa]
MEENAVSPVEEYQQRTANSLMPGARNRPHSTPSVEKRKRLFQRAATVGHFSTLLGQRVRVRQLHAVDLLVHYCLPDVNASLPKIYPEPKWNLIAYDAYLAYRDVIPARKPAILIIGDNYPRPLLSRFLSSYEEEARSNLWIFNTSDTGLQEIARILTMSNAAQPFDFIFCFCDFIAIRKFSDALFTQDHIYNTPRILYTGWIEELSSYSSWHPDLVVLAFSNSTSNTTTLSSSVLSSKVRTFEFEISPFGSYDGVWTISNSCLSEDGIRALQIPCLHFLELRNVTLLAPMTLILSAVNSFAFRWNKTVDANRTVYKAYGQGIDKRFMNNLAWFCGFKTYEILPPEDGQFGSYDPERRLFTGMIGDVAMRKADMAIGMITENDERTNVTTFSKPYLKGTLAILTLAPGVRAKTLLVLKPFTLD